MYSVIRKSQPTASDSHIDKPLTNISIAYIQQQNVFIADKVFPTVPVDKQSDKYFTYTKNDWFRDEAKVRPPATESVGSGFNLSSTSYYADVWAIHKDIPDQVRANTDMPINPERDATEFVTQRLLISRERQFVTNYFSSGTWTDVTGGTDFTAWSNFATSDPVGDVTLGMRTILKKTGYKPNVMVLGGEVWDKLKNHPDILERIKYTQRGVLSEDIVAQVFGIDRIVVADGVYATNEETTGADSSTNYVQIFGKNVLLAYAAPSPSILQPSAGYNFAWTGYGGRNAYGVNVNRYRIDLTKSDRIEGELAYDMKVVGADLGYFFSGAST